VSMSPERTGRARANRRRQGGQTLVLFAFFLVVLLGASALTVDYGTWLLAKRGYQNVTDAAALAGVIHLTRPRADLCTGTKTKATCAREAAWTSVKQQLGLSALDAVTQSASNTSASSPYTESGYRIWVDAPPTAAGAKYAGTRTSDGNLLVRVERDNPSYFARVLGQGDQTVSAWSTAGLFPNRWAIIGLCAKSTKTTDCPQAQDVTIAGTNTAVRVVDGDFGSNWGLAVTSASSPGIVLPGDSLGYMVDYDQCGTSTFLCPPSATGGFQDGGSPAVAKPPLALPVPIADPAYALPPWIGNSTAVPSRPDFNGDSTGNPVNPTSANVSCAAGSTVLGPGSYNKIIVKKGCVILDPTFGLTAGQQPGIFRIQDTITLGNDAFVIGDGVSLFFDSGVKQFTINNGAGIVINTGNAGHPEQAKGGWTTLAVAPWSACAALGCTPTYTPNANGIGIAFYVMRPAGGPPTTIFNMSGGTGLAFRGALYAPRDTVGIGGNSAQASAGQIVGYTIRYNGSATLVQTYEGPSDERPYLLEPTLGQ
jgi:putative Flp pilus-assembly TadE/G-like protein